MPSNTATGVRGLPGVSAESPAGHARHRCGKLHSDSGLLGPCDEQINEVGIELAEGSVAVVDDHAVHPGARSDMREFEGNEPATDEHDPVRQRFEVEVEVEVEEVGAVDQKVLARETQRARARPGCDQETLRTVFCSVDFELVRSGESGATVEGRHPVAGEFVLHALRHSIGEASLMAHQRRPSRRR